MLMVSKRTTEDLDAKEEKTGRSREGTKQLWSKDFEQAKLISKRLSFLSDFYSLNITNLDGEFLGFLRGVFSSTDADFLQPSPCFGGEEGEHALIITQLRWQCQQGAHCNLPAG